MSIFVIDPVSNTGKYSADSGASCWVSLPSLSMAYLDALKIRLNPQYYALEREIGSHLFETETLVKLYNQ